MYNRSMKSSIAAFKYGARKEYGRYYAVELAKKHESWIKKTGAHKPRDRGQIPSVTV